MVNPEDIVTALKCVDGKSVVIDSTYIDRCQLFDSLPSQPDEVAVPFSEGEVSTWRASCDAERPLHGVGFLECVSIMKVADFLHDDESVEAAAKAANAAVLQPSRKRKLSAPRPKGVTKRLVTALKSLPAHIAHIVLRSGGQFQDWMRVLPISCLPIMVPAAVSNSGTLILQPDEQDSEVLKQMIAHAKPLATIFNLEVVFTVDRGASAAASKAIDSIGTMTQLRGLTMRNMSLPEVPATLTALTNLRLDNSYTRSPRAKLTTDISAFIGLQSQECKVLVFDDPCYSTTPSEPAHSQHRSWFMRACLGSVVQELAFINVMIFNFENFSNQLRSLTALSSLELCCPVSKDRQIAITGQMSRTFADALTTLTGLANLTLGIPQTIQESNMRSFQRLDTISPKLHNSIVRRLPTLPHLTSLSFAGLVDCRIDPAELKVAFSSMLALKSLRIRSERNWEEYYSKMRRLPALEHFHLESDTFIRYIVGSQLPHRLPTSLKCLKMDAIMATLPDLSRLSQLQSIELNGCCLWCESTLPPGISALTGLTSLHTGPPVEDPALFRKLVRPNHDFTPEADLILLLSRLPASLMELTMPEHRLPPDAVKYLSAYANLVTLDVGEMVSNDVLVPLKVVIPMLQQLRTLRIRCDDEHVSWEARCMLLSALVVLPSFKELDHGPDPRELWVSQELGEIKFRLISE